MGWSVADGRLESWWLRNRSGFCRLAIPDESSAIVINSLRVRIEQLFPQGCKVLVIQLELEREHALRNASLLL